MCEGFFWALFVWWDVPKKAWQCGGRCQTYGFPFEASAKAFFGPFLCGGTFQKKPWKCGGRRSVFWSGFFSDLSGIVPCQTYGFPLGFFWTLFVCEGFFWTLFVWWDVPKKTLAVGGQVFHFLVRLLFKTFVAWGLFLALVAGEQLRKRHLGS